MRYTAKMGEAANAYHAQLKNAHPLPAQWRWECLWTAMLAAAPEEHVEPTVTVRYDLSPAQVEGKVREQLVKMGWTPPRDPADPKLRMTDEQIQNEWHEAKGYFVKKPGHSTACFMPFAEYLNFRRDLDAKTVALAECVGRLKLRIVFIGWPGESYFNVGSDKYDWWVPDWRYELALIEHALHGTPVDQPEKPTDTTKSIDLKRAAHRGYRNLPTPLGAGDTHPEGPHTQDYVAGYNKALGRAAEAMESNLGRPAAREFSAWVAVANGVEDLSAPRPAVAAETATPRDGVKHPVQPLCEDKHGVLRFKANAIVRYLLDNGGIGMNALAVEDFTREDREQFAQLIGYSHTGAGTLSYMSDAAWFAAQDEYVRRFAPPEPAGVDPVPMILHCPRCHLQHIDEPRHPGLGCRREVPASPPGADGGEPVEREAWMNPPHRSHLCAGCGFIWRPADVPTTGVAAITTRGQNDSTPHVAEPVGVVFSHSWYDSGCGTSGSRERQEVRWLGTPPKSGTKLFAGPTA